MIININIFKSISVAIFLIFVFIRFYIYRKKRNVIYSIKKINKQEYAKKINDIDRKFNNKKPIIIIISTLIFCNILLYFFVLFNGVYDMDVVEYPLATIKSERTVIHNYRAGSNTMYKVIFTTKDGMNETIRYGSYDAFSTYVTLNTEKHQNSYVKFRDGYDLKLGSVCLTSKPLSYKPYFFVDDDTRNNLINAIKRKY